MASNELLKELRTLFKEMEERYDELAAEYGFSCTGCEQNCCLTGFKHYTLLEYELLREGLAKLTPEKHAEIRQRAEDALLEGERAPCPLLEGSLCGLYEERLMICRMHGLPYAMKNPRGVEVRGDGCLRFRDQHAGPYDEHIDRTPLYQRFAALERRARDEAAMEERLPGRSIPEMILDLEEEP